MEKRARWNLDNYCEDSLKFHTYFDSDMKFNYESVADAVDENATQTRPSTS